MKNAENTQKNTPVKQKPAKAPKNTLAKKNKFGVAFILKMVCILAMALFIGSMFLDYWTFETISKEDHRNQVLYNIEPTPIDKTISIGEYLWMTEDNEDLFGDPDDDKQRLVNNYWTGEKISQNEIVNMPFYTTVLMMFALIFFLLNMKSVWPSILSLAAGIYALLTLLQDKAGVFKPFSGIAKIEMTEGKGIFATKYFVEKPFTSGISYNLVLIAAGILTAASLAVFIVWVIRVIKWFTVKEVRY